MAKFQIDMSSVKQYLFEKGEKVGLIVCLALMVLVVGLAMHTGLTSGGSDAGRPWEKEIAEGAQRLRAAINSADLPDDQLPPPIDPEQYRWYFMPSNYSFVPLFPLPDRVSSKKSNPKVLQPYAAVRNDQDKWYHADYIRGLYYCWRIDVAGKKAWVLEGGGSGIGGFGPGTPPGGAPGMSAGGPKGGVGMPQGGAGGGLTNLLKDVKPVRMLVYTGLFPMRDQLEEFRKALRYVSVDELLTHRSELPQPTGIEVMRVEILPNGQPATDWQPLVKFDDKTGRMSCAASLKTMLREMLVDENEPKSMAAHVFPGMVMPLPLLANRQYAKIDLSGVEINKDVTTADDGGKPVGAIPGGQPNFTPKGAATGLQMPGKSGKPGESQPAGGGTVATGGTVKQVPWKNLAKEFQDKFTDRYFPDTLLHPLALPPTSDTATKGPGAGSLGPTGGQFVGSGMGMMGSAGSWGWDAMFDPVTGTVPGSSPPGVAPGGTGNESGSDTSKPEVSTAPRIQLHDAVIRFFDPDVQPGKTYRYAYRVRFANPNYNKKSEVAFQALADQKELTDWKDPASKGWTITPEFSIPTDFAWYAVDVTPDPKIKGGADAFPPPSTARPETTPVQVHQWLDSVTDDGGTVYHIGDWAIAERLYVRRGDLLGRYGIMVEVPQWKDTLQMFEIALSSQVAKSRPKAGQPKDALISSGIPVNLMSSPPTIVVDFEGGKKAGYVLEKRDGSRENLVADQCAVDILVLGPDGKLLARSSRTDSDENTPGGAERLTQFNAWRERLQELRRAASGDSGGVSMPTGGGNQGPR
ncbi:MAG: hypothetical protein NZO58_02500 [Gemmataceae bacterium]|nr:hypothetical protein [Gemmataceae bacterium]